GVDLGAYQRAGGGQPHHGPVVPAAAASPRFPPLPHHPGVPGCVEVVPVAVVHVARGDDDPAEVNGGEVGGDPVEQPGVGEHGAVDPQPGHAAVRVDDQPQGRDADPPGAVD